MKARKSELAEKVLSELGKQGKARDFVRCVRKVGYESRGESVKYNHNGKRYHIKQL